MNDLAAYWRDLSDGELRSRLEQRGYTDPIVEHWITGRDDPSVGGTITSILGRD
jgi:hypothetical protein